MILWCYKGSAVEDRRARLHLRIFIGFLVSASLLAQTHSVWIMILMLLMDAAKAISALCWLGYVISTFDEEEIIEAQSPRRCCCGYIIPTWTGLRHSFRMIREITAKAEAETDLDKYFDNISEKDPWQQKATGIASNLLSKKVQMSGLDEKGRKSAESSNFRCFLGNFSDVSSCFQHVASEMIGRDVQRPRRFAVSISCRVVWSTLPLWRSVRRSYRWSTCPLAGCLMDRSVSGSFQGCPNCDMLRMATLAINMCSFEYMNE